jgi:hypothetical protein
MKTFLFKFGLFTMIFLILVSFLGHAPAAGEAAPKPSNTPKATKTSAPTKTLRPTNTPKLTFTPIATNTQTAAATFTNTPTLTDIPTNTPTLTFTPTDMPTETPTATPAEPNLLAYWKFDEGSGTMAADDSGNGHTLQLTPWGNWTSSSAPTGFDNPNALDISYACSSDLGCKDYHSADTINLANQSFTAAMWFRRFVDRNEPAFFFSLGSAPSAYQTFHMGFRSSTIFTCGFWTDDLHVSGSFTNTDWHHYACSYDTATNTRKAYVDGLLVGSDHPAASFQGSGPVRLGTELSFLSADDVRLYGNALSDAQVSALVPRSAPCEINADELPLTGLKIPQLLQLAATDTNDCSVPLEYHWECLSDTSVECAAFLSEANTGPHGVATPVLNLQEFDLIQIWLTICEVGNPSNCSSLLRVYEGAPVD